MPELKCTVQTCMHNQDFLCRLDSIQVGGSQAMLALCIEELIKIPVNIEDADRQIHSTIPVRGLHLQIWSRSVRRSRSTVLKSPS